MLSFFTMALIGLFVLMTWFQTPSEPLGRYDSIPEDDSASVPENEDDVRAA